MITKIHKPQSYSSNKGSSTNAVQYLEKENIDKSFNESEHFFNQFRDNISGVQVENMLDNNHGRLSKDETKFYMLTVSPSSKELEIIGSNNENFKSFINTVMDKYAKNFERNYADNMPLTGNDLMYFAKLETQRSFKFENINDRKILEFNKAILKEISSNKEKIKSNPLLKKKLSKDNNNLNFQLKRNHQGKIIKEGVLKDGDNRHVHILVSRYDLQQKFKLSPLANARNTNKKQVGVGEKRKQVKAGFDREKFVDTVEKAFDKEFQYNREYKNTFKYRNAVSKGKLALSAINDPLHTTKSVAMGIVTNEIKKQINNGVAKKAFGVATTNPKKLPKEALRKVQKEAVKGLIKSAKLGAYTNPATAAVDIVLTTFKAVGKQISKGAGL